MIPEDSNMEEEYIASDDEENDNQEQYDKLHEAVAQLGNFKRVRPATRNELGSQISEFNVNKKDTVKLEAKELADVLDKKKMKNSKINKKAKKVSSKLKALPTPLEKPTADLIKRKVGFEIIQQQLQEWSAVVEHNRFSEHISFPLNQPSLEVKSGKDFFNNFVHKTDLEKDLEAVLQANKLTEKENKTDKNEVEVPEHDEFPLTMEEMVERRKEMAGIRARQSYREAKAFRQSKIKSKKYHRMMKRDKIKKEIKEFELLQKTNPEAALQKLDELEKTRAEERASLKHRSTGKWAKNLTVRAKYDQESRKVLAEQLAISRQATQKLKTADSSDDEEIDDNEPNPSVLKTAIDIAESNPWSLQVSSEVNTFISGFRKYWTENNKNSAIGSVGDKKDVQKDVEIVPSNGKAKEKINTKILQDTLKPGSSNKWTVSPVVGKPTPLRSKAVNFDIDEAFYLADAKLAHKITEKFKLLNGKIKPGNKRTLKDHKKKQKHELPDLKLKKSRWQVTRVQVDQELGNTSLEENEKSVNNFNISQVGEVSAEKEIQNPSYFSNSSALNIDPERFLKVKAKTLDTALPEDILGDDEDAMEDEQQQQLIMEAFADDNVADFRKEKEEAEKETEVPEVVAALPGWGSWSGAGVSKCTRKRRRFMKIPELPARKDKKLKDVIINENPNQKIKNHMVKELPFPFTSVEAFEANIRTPVSREWLPETVHRSLIKPAVLVKKGAIVEPINSDVLLRRERKARSLFKAKTKSKN